MILTTLPNTAPMIETGIACQIPSPAILTPAPAIIQSFCFCEYECEYEEPVFAAPGGTIFQNDKSSFVSRRIVAADSVDFELWKNGVLLSALTNATYGEYFDFGDFPTQPNVKGFIIDWEKVYNLNGVGRYQFKSVETILGTSTTFESRLFKLRLFDLEDANGTVRIETVQNGSINGGPTAFDFTGMEWPAMYRISGTVTGRLPTVEDDSYLNSAREYVPIQTKIINAYKLSSELIPRSVVNLLFDTVLSNAIFVTDYNLFSPNMITQGSTFKYNRIAMKGESFEEPKGFGMSQKEIYTINFVDRAQLPLKRTVI